MTAARQSPEFGLRLLAELTPEARAELVWRWSLAEPPPRAPVRPGLKKCSVAPAPAPASGLGAQLQAFARSIGRVG